MLCPHQVRGKMNIIADSESAIFVHAAIIRGCNVRFLKSNVSPTSSLHLRPRLNRQNVCPKSGSWARDGFKTRTDPPDSRRALRPRERS